ncbi:transcriptional regulator [Burkholderia sp. Ch1-1]|nr:transcriptional regulator [Burkholderia sp. Ch1-1]
MNINTLDLNLLRVFNAVYIEKNVSRAALTLGITQPAISNAMMRLRSAIGDQLFVRARHGVEPTATADNIAGPVQEALRLLSVSLETRISFDPKKSTRTFRFLMSDAGKALVLPRLMARLGEEAPEISVEIIQAPRTDYAEILEEGRADFAFGNLTFLKSGFYQQHLLSEPYRCICSPTHPIAKKRRLSMEDYLKSAHVGVNRGNADTLVERVLAKKRKHRKVQLRQDDYHVAVRVVAASRLLCTVPESMITHEVNAFPLPFSVLPADIRQFWHRRAHHDAANMWLRSLLFTILNETE